MYWPVEWIQGRRLRPLHELIAELGSYIGQRVWHVQCPGFLQSRKAAHFGGTRWNHDIQGDDNFSFDILLWLPPLSPATQQHPADNGFLYVVASPPYRSGFGLCFSILAWFVDVTPAHILCILELSAGAFPTLKAFYSLRFLFHGARFKRDFSPRLPTFTMCFEFSWASLSAAYNRRAVGTCSRFLVVAAEREGFRSSCMREFGQAKGGVVLLSFT